MTRDVAGSGTRAAALVRARAASLAIGPVTAGNVGHEESAVTAMLASDAPAATTIGREAMEDSATVPTKAAFPEPHVSGTSGVSVGNESETPDVRGVRSRDGFSAHWEDGSRSLRA